MNIQRVQVIARGLVQRSIGFRARLQLGRCRRQADPQDTLVMARRATRLVWVLTRYIRSVTQRR